MIVIKSIPKANTFKPVSKIVCRSFTASVSFGVRPVRLNLLPCKMILHTILRPYGMKSFRKSDFQGRQMSGTGRTAIADNAENRFIWKISCVLKVFVWEIIEEKGVLGEQKEIKKIQADKYALFY